VNSSNKWIPESAAEELLRDAAARQERWEATLAAFEKLEADYKENPTKTITLLR
jgi:hypothetical protein